NAGTDEGSWLARQHLCAVKSKRLRPEKRRARRIENVHAHVISIRPDAEMWIIEEVRTEMKIIAAVRPGCVAGGRYRDTLIRRNADARKLSNDPAAGKLVIKHNRISAAVVLTDTTKTIP